MPPVQSRRVRPPETGSGQRTHEPCLCPRLPPGSLLLYGYRVLIAENGTESVEAATLHRAKIDLLITDLV